MDVKKVFIIFERERFTREMILDDLRSEGFHYEFLTMDTVDSADLEDRMKEADEVWTFGRCDIHIAHVHALNQGKDIWEMA